MSPSTKRSPGVDRVAVTYREAAIALGVSERLVWQLVRDSKLKAIRFGRSVRIPIAELNALLNDASEQCEFDRVREKLLAVAARKGRRVSTEIAGAEVSDG